MRKVIFVPPIQVSWRKSFFEKLSGYIGRKELSQTEGLVLFYRIPSIINTSIHMMFVFTPLAVFWLDAEFKIVHKVIAKPWDAYHAAPLPACYVFETHPDHIDQWQLGDKIEFHDQA